MLNLPQRKPVQQIYLTTHLVVKLRNPVSVSLQICKEFRPKHTHRQTAEERRQAVESGKNDDSKTQ